MTVGTQVQLPGWGPFPLYRLLCLTLVATLANLELLLKRIVQKHFLKMVVL